MAEERGDCNREIASLFATSQAMPANRPRRADFAAPLRDGLV
jgi:hypothetical protein